MVNKSNALEFAVIGAVAGFIGGAMPESSLWLVGALSAASSLAVALIFAGWRALRGADG
jgi:hypothetical protein